MRKQDLVEWKTVAKTFSILLLTIFMMNNSLQAQGGSDVWIGDMNGDRVRDTLQFIRLANLQTPRTFVKVCDGKGEFSVEFVADDFNNKLLTMIPIPAVLKTPENNPMLEHAREYLLTDSATNNLPEAFKWIIPTQILPPTEPDSKYIAKAWLAKGEWFKKPFDSENMDFRECWIEVAGDTLKQLFNLSSALYQDRGKTALDYETAWLVYRGQYHGHPNYPQIVSSYREMEIWKTSQGVFLRKEDSVKWIFVNDEVYLSYFTGQKYRGVERVFSWEEFVFIETFSFGDEAYRMAIVDVDRDVVMYLRKGFIPQSGPEYQVIKGELIVTDINGKDSRKLPMEEVRQAVSRIAGLQASNGTK